MIAKKSADWISATLPTPPISKTNLPAGFSAEKIATSVAWRVVGERRIQWRAAFETLGDGVLSVGRSRNGHPILWRVEPGFDVIMIHFCVTEGIKYEEGPV